MVGARNNATHNLSRDNAIGGFSFLLPVCPSKGQAGLGAGRTGAGPGVTR